MGSSVVRQAFLRTYPPLPVPRIYAGNRSLAPFLAGCGPPLLVVGVVLLSYRQVGRRAGRGPVIGIMAVSTCGDPLLELGDEREGGMGGGWTGRGFRESGYRPLAPITATCEQTAPDFSREKVRRPGAPGWR